MSCAAALSFQASAQPAHAAATDADIATFQGEMEVGCVKRGIERQQPENEVRAFCTCMTATLHAKLTRDDWQRILDGQASARFEAIKTVMAPHMEALMLCKAGETGAQK